MTYVELTPSQSKIEMKEEEECTNTYEDREQGY